MKNTENIRQISIEDYNFELPSERIPKYPLEQRDQSKLLYFNNGRIEDKQFSNLHEILKPASFLVFNNTKVIQARLHFKKSTGASIEVFCLEPHSPNDYAVAFSQRKAVQWECMVGNAKKWKGEDLVMELRVDGIDIELRASKLKANGLTFIVGFTWDNEELTFSQILEEAGVLPIPPYLNRETEDSDNARYQTIYSKTDGSVAAPTAGLHFTPQVLKELESNGVETGELTLHVGAGTFKPVSAAVIADHEMHTEHFYITKAFLEQLIKNRDAVIAVGTTSVRTLETLYWLGVKLLTADDDRVKLSVSQWEVYELPQHHTAEEALRALFDYIHVRNLDFLHSATQIMIVPGYEFKVVGGLITNYHLPKSTLLLLVAALIGDDWQKVYEHALANDYRFLSYGDSSLLMKK